MIDVRDDRDVAEVGADRHQPRVAATCRNPTLADCSRTRHQAHAGKAFAPTAVGLRSRNSSGSALRLQTVRSHACSGYRNAPFPGRFVKRMKGLEPSTFCMASESWDEPGERRNPHG